MVSYDAYSHTLFLKDTLRTESLQFSNGVNLVDFAHFVKLIDASSTPLTIIEFVDEDFKKIILDTKQAKESFDDIKAIYGLHTDRRL